jgi:hypothetical protein
MRSTFLRLIWAGILTLALCSIGAAQAQRQKPSDTDKLSPGKTVTVTGCLQKGDETGEYTIKGMDGKTYGLRSTTAKLSDHVNQKVTVTGKTETEKQTSTSKKGGIEEYAHLNVTNLKMVSTTCQ